MPNTVHRRLVCKSAVWKCIEIIAITISTAITTCRFLRFSIYVCAYLFGLCFLACVSRWFTHSHFSYQSTVLSLSHPEKQTTWTITMAAALLTIAALDPNRDSSTTSAVTTIIIIATTIVDYYHYY